MHLTFVVAASPSVSCSVCSLPILIRTLSLLDTTDFAWYHIQCFRPYKCEQLTIDGLEELYEREAVSEGLYGRVKNQVKKWGEKVCVRREDVPSVYLKKRVNTVRPVDQYRALITAFSYLSPLEIDGCAAFVSKQWFHISRENDLWRDISPFTTFPHYPKYTQNYRSALIYVHLASCWHCHRPVSYQSLSFFCPMHRRPTCSQCVQSLGCGIMSVDLPNFDKCIDPSLFAKLRISTFELNSEEMVYTSDFCGKIIPYVENRRKLLLKLIKNSGENVSEKTVKCIKRINFGKFYRATKSYRKKVRDAVADFCGKDSENEEISVTFQEFRRNIQEN